MLYTKRPRLEGSPRMVEFNILGNSNATVSMILESLHRIHPGQVRIKIIENTLVDDKLPFAIDRFETDIFGLIEI